MFDLAALTQVVTQHTRVARVVVGDVKGSGPREVGASMLVWATGQSGTIGGGALEHQATQTARAMLETGGKRLDHQPLGPALNQCCGGAVRLVTEVFDTQNLPKSTALISRSIDGSAMPLALRRLIDRARAQGITPAPQLIQGWMVEPIARPSRAIWIWGAGHVGRALVQVLSPLPDLALTWIDTGPERFPEDCQNARVLPVPQPENAVPLAPKDAEHLILTYSHALDLALCHALLTHGFSACGLIGSATKWARFRSRLTALGHSAQSIARIACPIGDPSLGKHPQAIAISVAQSLLSQAALPRITEITGT